MPRLLAILLLCLAATMPAWRGVAAACAPAAEAGSRGVADTGCACGGACGMEGCACASPTDREPADTDHRAPAPREGKPLNLDMPRPARFLALEGVTRVARGPIAGERGASFSYDSIQSYLCIWRS